MTPHQVLSLLTQDQTHDLMCACAQYLDPARVMSALRQGLEPDELRVLHALLEEHFIDLEEES